MTLEEERERGARAKAILSEPIVIETLNVIRTKYFDAWRNSGEADSKLREHYFTLFNAVDEFEQHLTSVLKSGEMAIQQLK